MILSSPSRLSLNVPRLANKPRLRTKTHATKTGRVRLGPAEYHELRWQRCCLAEEKCERCGGPAPWEGHELVRGQLMHKQHGGRKTDTLAETEWGCPKCHDEEHNPKPCPPKPGRLLLKARVQQLHADHKYHAGLKCICGQLKIKNSSLCVECSAKLPPQMRWDLENLISFQWSEALGRARKFFEVEG